MDATTLEQEWDIITSFLPPGWREKARTTGALQRARNIPDADTLLLLILTHTAGGLSLRQTCARAKRTGTATLSDVSLLERLRKAGPWLHQLAHRMFTDSRFHPTLPQHPAGRRIRVIDATTIQEPGSTGTDWRLHYILQLPSLECDFFELTDATGGESYKRVPIQEGDIILGDRGYCNRQGVAHVVDSGGDAIVRLNSNSFPLLDEEGQAVDLLGCMRTLEGFTPGEWPVAFQESNRMYTGRLCAVRKTREAAGREKERAQKAAAKKGQKVRTETLELAEYTFILTTLPVEVLATVGVLDLYRARWQVELAFKRVKSLFGVGHVPKYREDSARAWIYAKLLAVLLIERMVDEAELFSPWGFRLRGAQSVA